MRSWFYKRGYPKGLVENEMGKVNSLCISEETKEKRKESLCDNLPRKCEEHKKDYQSKLIQSTYE